MAHVTLLSFTATSMIGDNNAQLEAGDVAALHVAPAQDRPGLEFDDTAERAAVTPETTMPGQYAAGTLKADVHYYSRSASADFVDFEVLVEAKTPDTDTLDLEAAESFDTTNSGVDDLDGTTAGDPRVMTVTLTNKDSVATGDLVRFGLRRDADDGTNDTATGDMIVTALEIWEDT